MNLGGSWLLGGRRIKRLIIEGGRGSNWKVEKLWLESSIVKYYFRIGIGSGD